MTDDFDERYVRAINRVTMRLPPVGKTRFIKFSPPIIAGQMEHEAEEKSFYLGSYYAHRIANNFYPVGGFNFIMSNGFLASHTYNLALVFAFHGSNIQAALRHNFKKFYAECALFRSNCLIGRGLLIETLAYEQDLMRPLFSAAAEDALLANKATSLSSVMSGILNGHEMWHYFQHRATQICVVEAETLYSGALARIFKEMTEQGAGDEAVETTCDGMGAWNVWRDDSDYVKEVPDPLSRLRLCAFGFLCFGELVSLQRSAWCTADIATKEDQSIALTSELRPKNAFTLARGRDQKMDARVATIINLLDGEARRRGATLFGDDPWFSLPPDTPAMLRDAFENFDALLTEAPTGLTGTDLVRRQMSQLLAESLHNHPDGAEHLLWRSKKFLSGGEAVDP